MKLSFAMINAYCTGPFGGNPAAVVYLEDQMLSDKEMQQIAKEMNVSETAFIAPLEQVNHFQLRWFTPSVEVSLCGHATLAAARFLMENKMVDAKKRVVFRTLSGDLFVEGNLAGYEMLLPKEEPKPCSMPEVMLEAIGMVPRVVAKNRLDYIVELASEQDVRHLQVNLALIASLDARGIVVTSRSDHNDVDIVCRTFYPAIGISEDPVTGSAFCALAPYWLKKLRDHKELIVAQLSERGGQATLSLQDEYVLQQGQCFTWTSGSLHL